MRIGVLGAGPVGTVCAAALARRGHEVLLVDRDPGPPDDGALWQRQGVMQFLHPHFWRLQVHDVLQEHLPEAWDALVAAGGVPTRMEQTPEGHYFLACRRWVAETALRRFAAGEPGVTVLPGYVDEVLLEQGRAVGVRVDGDRVELDLVLDVTGRSGRLMDSLRPPVEGGPCGFSYVSRMYRAKPGAEVPGPMPIGEEHDGYIAIVFPQDDRTISALLVRASGDERLTPMRRTDGWETLVRSVPLLARWTDPEQYEAITPVLPGGGLTNTYRRQVDDQHPAVPGVLFLGDTVCTVNPSGGRGIALGLLQAQALLEMLDGAETGTGSVEVAERFDAWCEQHIRPWYDDHVLSDRTTLQRWAGEGVDVEGPLPSDVVAAAAQAEPSMMAVVGPYLSMLAPPTALDAVADDVRAMLRSGWRPSYAPGPTADDLAEALLART